MRSKFLFALIALCAVVFFASSARASLLLDAASRGALLDGTSTSGGSGLAIGNYATGECATCGTPAVESRSFFVFDLTGVTGTITSATLQLAAGLNVLQGTRTLNIFDVSSSSLAPLMSGGASSATFTDLGSGTLFGSVAVDSSISGAATVNIMLDAAALAALNGAEGGQIGFGGALSGFTSGIDDLIFGFTGGGVISNDCGGSPVCATTLTLNTVPEPTTLALFGTGIAGLALLRRRRSSAERWQRRRGQKGAADRAIRRSGGRRR